MLTHGATPRNIERQKYGLVSEAFRVSKSQDEPLTALSRLKHEFDSRRGHQHFQALRCLCGGSFRIFGNRSVLNALKRHELTGNILRQLREHCRTL